MTMIASEAELVQMAWNGFDATATHHICDATLRFYDAANDAENLPHVSARVKPLRGNLNLVPEPLRNTFERAADLQDEYLNDPATENTILAGVVHHYNVVRSESDENEWTLQASASVTGPRAYDCAFILTNPYNLDLDWKTNLEFLTDPDRLKQQFRIVSDKMGISVEELAKATVFHCFTMAAKRYWSENDYKVKNNGAEPPLNMHGSVNDQEVGAEYFVEFAKRIAPIAGFDFK